MNQETIVKIEQRLTPLSKMIFQEITLYIVEIVMDQSSTPELVKIEVSQGVSIAYYTTISTADSTPLTDMTISTLNIPPPELPP